MFSSNDQRTGLSLTILKHCKTTDLHAPSTQISNHLTHRRTVMHGNAITKTHMLLTRQLTQAHRPISVHFYLLKFPTLTTLGYVKNTNLIL